MPTQDDKTIKITLDDLKNLPATPDTSAAIPATAPGSIQAGAAKTYGNVSSESTDVPISSQAGNNILLQAWFYLGAAGLVGALAGWAICEPAFIDGAGRRWGNYLMLMAIVTMMCVGFGVAESIVEQSVKKGVLRTALALPLGMIFGIMFDFTANVVYNVGLSFAAAVGVRDFHNPVAWIARALAWVVFGIAGGLVYGIIGQSAKKAQYGILGGMLGAGLGGLLFDPISFVHFGFHGAALSRMVGFGLFGMATGASMGVIESALKDRWLHVSSGPLAGKQFILYKPATTIGSSQSCDIYLFKDPNILPQHALIESRGSRLQIRANGLSYVSGQPVQTRVLQDGDLIQIGRYGFRYKERQK